MNKTLLILLAITASAVQAEVFKCTLASGAAEYQPTPCITPKTQQKIVDVKPLSPQQEEQARLKLQEWYKKQETHDTTKKHLKKDRQAERDKKLGLSVTSLKAAVAGQQTTTVQPLVVVAKPQNKTKASNDNNAVVLGK